MFSFHSFNQNDFRLSQVVRNISYTYNQDIYIDRSKLKCIYLYK